MDFSAFTKFLGASKETIHHLENKEKFHSTMELLSVKNYKKEVNKLLLRFRLMFEKMPFKYEGDEQIYRMFKSGILAGFDVKTTTKKIDEILDREYLFAQYSIQLGKGHHFFDFENLTN